MEKYSVEIWPGSAENRPTEQAGLYFTPDQNEEYPVGPAPLSVRARRWQLSNGSAYGGIEGCEIKVATTDESITGHQALETLTKQARKGAKK